MKGILVVAHGSRAKETEKALEATLEIVKKNLPEEIVEHAYMEFSERTINYAVEKLVEKGVREIKVVPYFLFSGVHIKEDIPNIIKECLTDYPDVKITMGEVLGVDERMADVLVDRIKGR